MISKFFLPFDVFIRHQFTSHFILLARTPTLRRGEAATERQPSIPTVTSGGEDVIKENASVLDAGGSLSKIQKFVKTAEFKTADIQKGADIVFSGKRLPLKDRSFDLVVSLDTLEHIKKKARRDFLSELLRVARQRVIIAAPLGTKRHQEYERELVEKLKKEKKKIPVYLKEHVNNGLPTLEEIKDFLPPEYQWKIYFSGNLCLTEKLFRLHLFEFKNPILNHWLYYSKFLINAVCNLLFYPFLINLPFRESINRFYLVIEKP